MRPRPLQGYILAHQQRHGNYLGDTASAKELAPNIVARVAALQRTLALGLAVVANSTQLNQHHGDLAYKLATTLGNDDFADICFAEAFDSGKVTLASVGTELVAGVIPLLQLAVYACIALHAPGSIDSTSDLQRAAYGVCFHQGGRIDFRGFTELLCEYAKLTGTLRKYNAFDVYKPLALALGESVRNGAIAELGGTLSWGTFVRHTMNDLETRAPDLVPTEFFDPKLLHKLILRIDEFQTAVLRDQHLCGGSRPSAPSVRAIGPARPARTRTPPSPAAAIAPSPVHFLLGGDQCWTSGCAAARKSNQNQCPECNSSRPGTWACSRDLYINSTDACHRERCTMTRADAALPPIAHAPINAAALSRVQEQLAIASSRTNRRELNAANAARGAI